jgi:hypothetical protein
VVAGRGRRQGAGADSAAQSAEDGTAAAGAAGESKTGGKPEPKRARKAWDEPDTKEERTHAGAGEVKQKLSPDDEKLSITVLHNLVIA